MQVELPRFSPLPSPPGWRLPLVATGGVYLALIGFSVIASILVWAVTGNMSSPPQSYGFALMVFASPLSVLAVTALVVLLNKPKAREQLALRRTDGKSIALAIVSTLAISQAGSSVAVLLDLDMGAWTRQLVTASSGPLPHFALMLLAGAVGAGICEELFMRGYLQQRLARDLGPWLGILLTSICFGVMHFYPVHMLFAGLMGVMMGLIAYATRSTIPSIIAHVVNNAFSLAACRLFGTETPDISWYVVGPAFALTLFGLGYFGRITWLRWRDERRVEDERLSFVRGLPRYPFAPAAPVVATSEPAAA